MKKLLTILSLFPLLTIGQTLKLNNGTVSISSTGDLTYNFVHGVATSKNTSYAPTLTQNVPFKLAPGMTAIEQDEVTIAGDTITGIQAGDYELFIWTDLSSANNNDFQIKLYVNSVAMSSFWRGTTTGAVIIRRFRMVGIRLI